MDDINLRREIAYEMKPYLEHLQMTIKAGEADYFLYVEETKKMEPDLKSLLYCYLMRLEARLPVDFLAGAALFLACNPARKQT